MTGRLRKRRGPPVTHAALFGYRCAKDRINAMRAAFATAMTLGRGVRHVAICNGLPALTGTDSVWAARTETT